VQDDGGEPATVTEIAQFEREGLDVGSLGLHLAEAKSLLGRLQRTMVAAQVAEAVARTSVCPTCGAQLACKGHHHLSFVARSGDCRLTVPGCIAAGGAKATAPPSVRSPTFYEKQPPYFARKVNHPKCALIIARCSRLCIISIIMQVMLNIGDVGVATKSHPFGWEVPLPGYPPV
jgi:hypothetical protein